MTADLKSKLIAQLSDEISDAEWYMTRAAEAKNGGDALLSVGLQRIALEEYSHARFLRHSLLREGVQIPPNEEAGYKNVWLLMKSHDE